MAEMTGIPILDFQRCFCTQEALATFNIASQCTALNPKYWVAHVTALFIIPPTPFGLLRYKTFLGNWDVRVTVPDPPETEYPGGYFWYEEPTVRRLCDWYAEDKLSIVLTPQCRQLKGYP